MAKKQLPAKGRSGRKGSRYDRTVAVGIIIVVVAIALILWGPLRKFRSPGGKRPAAEQAVQKEQSAPEKSAKKPPVRVSKKEPPRSSTTGPALLGGVRPERTVFVAIVIDDLGQDLEPARDIMSLPRKITCAVMPGLAQSRKVAELALRNKREVLLHLPMEPKDRNLKASPGTLRSDMTPLDFLTTISDDVSSVPGAVGVNNHEGSALTENKEAMKFLMAELRARNLLFLDSLTNPKSVAYATAKEFGLKAAKRDVFLDNEGDNEVYIGKQLEELARIAQEHGRAIGIGHPHPATINALRKWLNEADKQGITIVPVSRLVN
ncbi:MAG TPA: divergent polysaccharide deacetylase family protein [Nitrospirota bacterium]|nr:divergent polysaccharide deacetylase family protein [Nitrospirota bacterium]